MMPKQSDMEIPLLKCLDEMGGKGRPSDIYSRIRKFFSDLTESDLAEALSSGGNKWTNRIQWVRQTLISRGDMESPQHGVWAITEKGRRRLAAQDIHLGSAEADKQVSETGRTPAANLGETESEHGRTAAPYAPEAAPEKEIVSFVNLEELADEYFAAFKEKTLQKLQDLTPKQFERFAAALLSAYGFVEIKVTGRAGDGGIDGHGKLKVGLATMNVAFQCKRWQGMVSRPEVDKFRGAIQGEFEQGIFLTTSDFSLQAREASIKKGAAPVVLLNGEAIVQLMVEKGLGVKRRPVEVYEDQIDTLFEEGETF